MSEGINTKQRGFNFKVLEKSAKGGTSFKDLGYEDFDPAETYAAGDVVIYSGKLYEFTESHTGAWTGTDAKPTSVAESVEEGKHPYISLERLREYLYRVTFDKLTADNGEGNPTVGGCSSFVKDGKLYRNLDFKYDNAASFIVRTKDFEGMSFITGLNDGGLDDALVAQLPYRIVDGVNNNGIKVSTHVLFNDWEWAGAGEKSIPLTRLPYLVLTMVKSMDTISTDLADVLGNLAPTEAMGEYLLQVLVTDGTTTYAILPPTSANSPYVLQDISANPKLTNFRWLERTTVYRSDVNMQTRPTGIERFNLMPCQLEDLRFTKAYEAPTRLSEFIGIDSTTKDSTDEELEAIYDEARAAYLDRGRDGATWHTMHSVVYGEKMESLWIQENWNDNVIPASAEALEGLGTELEGKINDEEAARQALSKLVNADGSIEEFDATIRYVAGSYCIKDGYVYRFTSTHEIGPWSGNDAVQTSVFDELESFVSGDNENIYIQLQSSDGELTLEGLQVSVSFEDGSPTQMLTADEDGKCDISIEKNKVVTLSVADKLGYQHVPSQTLRTNINARYVFFTYETEITSETCTVQVELVPSGGRPETYSEFVGKTVNLILSDGTARSAVTDSNRIATFLNVTKGLEVRTGNPKVTGFVTPAAKNFSTNFDTVGFTLAYNAIKSAGIYMVNQNGDDVAYEAWDTDDTLVAIHVATSELAEAGCDYYVPVEELVEGWFTSAHNKAWATSNVLFPNVPNYNASSPYYNGQEATINMISDAATLEIQSPAAEFAVEQRFTLRGITAQGYIGTRDQFQVFLDNYEVISNMLLIEGMSFVIKSKSFWTSSQNGYNRAFHWSSVDWSSSRNKYEGLMVVPFYAI